MCCYRMFKMGVFPQKRYVQGGGINSSVTERYVGWGGRWGVKMFIFSVTYFLNDPYRQKGKEVLSETNINITVSGAKYLNAVIQRGLFEEDHIRSKNESWRQMSRFFHTATASSIISLYQ